MGRYDLGAGKEMDRRERPRQRMRSPVDRRRRDSPGMMPHRGGGGGGGGPILRDPYDDPYMRVKPEREPVPYKILCVANLNNKVGDNAIRDALMREFTRFGDVSVKVCHDANERFAYIYFRAYEEAREARHAKSRLILFDKPLEIDPIYERPMPTSSRRRSPTPDYGPPPPPQQRMRGPPPGSPPPHGRRPMQHSGGPPPPPPAYSRGYGNHSHHYGEPPMPPHHSHRGGGGGGMHHSGNGNGRGSDYHPGGHGGNGNGHHHQPPPHHHQPQLPHHQPPPPPHHHSGGHGAPMHGGGGGAAGHMNNGSNNGGVGGGGGGGGHGLGNSPLSLQQQQAQRALRESKKDKFPNYLHHIAPEEDDKATRTLFVGNLEVTISDQDLKRIFERYGVVEDIDVKRPPPGQGNAYAFIKFLNLDMAHRCKVEMSGQYIGKFQCKIGYGKCTPTTRIWVGGLGSWTSLSHLEREFDRFGAIRKIDFVKGDNHAYIQYDSIDAAQAACQEMRGFPLGGPDKRLRVDFADPEPYSYGFAGSPSRPAGSTGDQAPFAGDSAKPSGPEPTAAGAKPGEPGQEAKEPADESKPANGAWWPGAEAGQPAASPRSSANKRPRTPEVDAQGKRVRTASEERGNGEPMETSAASVETAPVADARPAGTHLPESVSSVGELIKCCAQAWNGVLMVKNSAFPARMLLCGGDPTLVELLMKDANGDLPNLRITQRLRLDPVKLDDVTRRMETAGPSGHCILLTTPAASSSANGGAPATGGSGSGDESVQNRPLRNLVSYLKQKDAAGVISLNSTKDGREALGVLYACPTCAFALDLLKKLAPNLQADSAKDDFLVIVVVKGTN